MDAFTDIGWFLYISLDSYKVWMHLHSYIAFTDIGWFLYISLDSYEVWMHLQTFYQKCVPCFTKKGILQEISSLHKDTTLIFAYRLSGSYVSPNLCLFPKDLVHLIFTGMGCA